MLVWVMKSLSNQNAKMVAFIMFVCLISFLIKLVGEMMGFCNRKMKLIIYSLFMS